MVSVIVHPDVEFSLTFTNILFPMQGTLTQVYHPLRAAIHFMEDCVYIICSVALEFGALS